MKIQFKCPACMADPSVIEAASEDDAHMAVYLEHKAINERARRDCGAAQRIEYGAVIQAASA